MGSNRKHSNDLLANTLANRYRYVLVDEFQDTDEMQWTILKAHVGLRLENGNRRIYLVGDPKQAIYRFRGGDLCTFWGSRILPNEYSTLQL